MELFRFVTFGEKDYLKIKIRMQTDMDKEDVYLDPLNQQRAVIYWKEIDNTGQVGPVFVSTSFVSYYFT